MSGVGILPLEGFEERETEDSLCPFRDESENSQACDCSRGDGDYTKCPQYKEYLQELYSTFEDIENIISIR